MSRIRRVVSLSLGGISGGSSSGQPRNSAEADESLVDADRMDRKDEVLLYKDQERVYFHVEHCDLDAGQFDAHLGVEVL